jgi:hypothetical protein
MAAGNRHDVGTTGVSGSILSVSTRLSTVTAVVATLATIASGLVSVRAVGSGHAIDLYTYTDLGAASNLSGTVNWIAAGD